VLAAVAVLGAALLAATAVTWSTSWAALMPLTACVARFIPLAVWIPFRRRAWHACGRASFAASRWPLGDGHLWLR